MGEQDGTIRKFLGVGLFVVLSWISPSRLVAQGVGIPVLNAGEEEQVATAGYYTLSWTMPTDTRRDEPLFELIEAPTAAFTDTHRRYQGLDLATTISGKADGTYFYRVHLVGETPGQEGSWSNVHRVVVVHHPLRRAFAFLILGAVVFAATIGMILYGHRDERRAAAVRLL